MNSGSLRWGVLSTANIGRAAVIPAIKASGSGAVVAVASRDAAKGAAFAEKLGIERVHASYAALLADDQVDAVYIPLPNSLHHEWVIKAAAAGKHILCEKPLGMTAGECLEMAAAADAAKVKLMEAFMYRFHPQFAAAQQLIQGGAIGALRHLHATFTFNVTNPTNIRLQPALGGGALMDVGCYCVNSIRTLAGREPVEVQAWAAWHAQGVDERMVGVLRFADGLTGQFDCALNLARRETILAAGADANLELPRAFVPGVNDTVVSVRRSYSDVQQQIIPGDDEYRLMVEHFAACVSEDRTPAYPATEAALNLRVIEALYRSARAGGRPAPVDPPA